jgi:Family of unknown function (DUF5771)
MKATRRSKLRSSRKTRCKKGYIVRKGYTRRMRSGKLVRVQTACIKDRGLPGKGYKGDGPGIGPLREGDLSQFGYSGVADLSAAQRHAALKKAVAQYGSLSVFRKLNAVAVYTKYTSPTVSRIFKADMAWVKREFGLKAF